MKLVDLIGLLLFRKPPARGQPPPIEPMDPGPMPMPQPAPLPIEPMPDPEPSPRRLTGKEKLAGTVGGAAVAAALIALVAGWEGKRNDPYRDLVGVWTVCYGETRVAMRRYSDAECEEMLAEGLDDFARPVLKRNPELKGRPNQLIAATSLSYNIGAAAYNRSTVARRFSERRWREGCDAMLWWNKAGGRVVKGLVNRRKAEHRICVTGLP